MRRLEFYQNYVLKDLVCHEKDLGIYSVRSGELLEGLLQGSDVVSLIFQKIVLGVVENGGKMHSPKLSTWFKKR